MTRYKYLILGFHFGENEMYAVLGFNANSQTFHEVLHCLSIQDWTDSVSLNVGKNPPFSAA